MKKRTEETTFQKIVVVIIEISIAAMMLAIAFVLDFGGGYLLALPFAAAVIIEFFRKDDHKTIFRHSDYDTSPLDGELVSYQEYPENANGVKSVQGYDKYRKNSNYMDDISTVSHKDQLR